MENICLDRSTDRWGTALDDKKGPDQCVDRWDTVLDDKMGSNRSVRMDAGSLRVRIEDALYSKVSGDKKKQGKKIIELHRCHFSFPR